MFTLHLVTASRISGQLRRVVDGFSLAQCSEIAADQRHEFPGKWFPQFLLVVCRGITRIRPKTGIRAMCYMFPLFIGVIDTSEEKNT